MDSFSPVTQATRVSFLPSTSLNARGYHDRCNHEQYNCAQRKFHLSCAYQNLLWRQSTAQSGKRAQKSRQPLPHDPLKLAHQKDVPLREHQKGCCRFFHYPFRGGGMEPNPRHTTVNSMAALCKRENIDVILAGGGGSVIDCAKFVSTATFYDGDAWDFFAGKARMERFFACHNHLDPCRHRLRHGCLRYCHK